METICNKCRGFCPSGTLDNGLCSDCNMVGKTINVRWGQFGIIRAVVKNVSKNGVVYAARLCKGGGETSARRLFLVNGIYSLYE